MCKQEHLGELKRWIKTIINHFWWSCATCNKNAKELKEKWLSILYHITGRIDGKIVIYSKSASTKNKKNKHHCYGYKMPVLRRVTFHSMFWNLHSFELMLGTSHPEVFCKKVTFKSFTKLTGKHLCQSPLFKKVAGHLQLY